MLLHTLLLVCSQALLVAIMPVATFCVGLNLQQYRSCTIHEVGFGFVAVNSNSVPLRELEMFLLAKDATSAGIPETRTSICSICVKKHHMTTAFYGTALSAYNEVLPCPAALHVYRLLQLTSLSQITPPWSLSNRAPAPVSASALVK
jgi:hypothetical protein